MQNQKGLRAHPIQQFPGSVPLSLFSGHIRVCLSNKDHSVIQQVISEHLLHARHCSKPWATAMSEVERSPDPRTSTRTQHVDECGGTRR